MKLQYLLAIFLFISAAPISVYAEQEQEPELTDFSTTSKLSGVVRFVLGNAYRNNGYANFGQASALTNLADLYGHRAYDGSIASVQPRSINMIDSPLSQGEAFIFYRASAPAKLSRELAFSTTWTGYLPNNINTTSSSSTNAFAEPASSNVMQGVGSGQNLLINPSTNRPLTQAQLTRISLFTDSGFKQTVQLASSSFSLEYLMPATNIYLPLQGNQIPLLDRYGRTNALFATTSGTSSSDFNSSKILLDPKDLNALVALANEARRVKNYAYYNNTANLVVKPIGVYDPISIAASAERNYQAVNAAGNTVDNFSGAGLGLVVTPGGLVTNPTIYNNLLNYLIAEYGSLAEDQRRVGYVQNAATKFVRNLAAYNTNKNYVADNNAFTFSHDASLSFDTSFSGVDKLQIRVRSNNIYSFAARTANPAAGLAYDGTTIDWPNGATPFVFLDRLFYAFPLNNSINLSLGVRLGQDGFLPSRGSFYSPSALLEFFSSAAGVLPSYTGSGAGFNYGPFQLDFLSLKNLRFGIGYLTNEADAVSPDANNIMAQGWFSANTRLRIPLQLAWQSSNSRWLFTANYAYERGHNSMGAVGTQLALTPFMYASLNEANQLGVTIAHQIGADFSVTAAYGHGAVKARFNNSVLGVKMTSAGDLAQLNSWMLALNFNNLFIKGNSAGIGVGGVPALQTNRSSWNSDASMPIALETWYQFQLSDNISFTPGIFYISATANSDGLGAGSSWGAVLKTQFNF